MKFGMCIFIKLEMTTETKLIEYVTTMRQTNKNKQICENEKNL